MAKLMLSLKIFVQILFVSTCFANYNQENYFENFVCDIKNDDSFPQNCVIKNIFSGSKLQKIFEKLDQELFEYYDCTNNNCNYYGGTIARNDLTEYPNLEFQNSNFNKFPSGNFLKLQKLKTLTAKNVNVKEINRDDFKSFKSLTTLELSDNEIKSIGSLAFLYLESLQSLFLSNNQIESIHENAFEECSKNLKKIFIDNNKLKQISDNIFDLAGTTINFDNNEIEKITQTSKSRNSTRNFVKISFSNNKLKQFNFNCTIIEHLFLDSNLLEEFDNGNCTINFLNLTDNFIENANLPAVSSLFISKNPKLLNLTVKAENLIQLEIRNALPNIITFDLLQKASKLENLDATNTFLGKIKIDTFSEMKALKKLLLSNTGLSYIEYGMFSHQEYVETLDISNNNLISIDLKMLTSMKTLKSIDISGNNLTSLDNAIAIKRTFPNLNEIGIDNNSWNCSYLATLYKTLEENSISIKQPANVVKNSSNVMGMGCTTSSELKINLFESDKANAVLVQKMNEIIKDINAEKTKTNNMRYDGEIIRAELFHIQKAILDLKTTNLKSQFVLNTTSRTNESGVDLTVVRNMMEQLNNFTLEKQKLANDQLQLKIDQLYVQLTKKDLEHDNFVKKSHLKDILSDNQENKNKNADIKYEYIKSTDGSDNKATNILLTMLVTAFCMIAVIFGYLKLKNLLSKRDGLSSVRARSTNTLNTTVELPFN